MKDLIAIIIVSLLFTGCMLLGYTVEVQNNTGSTIYIGDTQLDDGGFIWVTEDRATEIEEEFGCKRSGDLLSIEDVAVVEINLNFNQ